MKVTSRFMIRAGLGLCVAGALGAFGACSDDGGTNPPPPPPPPPPLAVPTNLSATAVSATQINVAWQYSDTTITGFRLDRCSGANCTTFAQLATRAKTELTFSDTGLTASTVYMYRVRAQKGNDTSAWTAPVSATTLVAATAFTLLTTGEISTCNSDAGPRATAAIVDGILKADPNAFVVTTGNNLAGAGGTFETCFDGKGWGALKPNAHFALGNGDFDGRDAAAVYGYFGDRAGPANKGWFSFDKGNWHIVVLNTSDRQHGEGATFGVIDANPDPLVVEEAQVPSEQVDWLAADLGANTKRCVAVVSWERRFYTTGSGGQGRAFNMVRLGGIMREHGVDLLISAKDKVYSRFAPMDVRTAAPDPGSFRQFIVGTGGRTGDQLPPAPPMREAGFAAPDLRGVLKLTLADTTYSWEFINAIAGGPTDTGSATCH